jgi:hypothetical protein
MPDDFFVAAHRGLRGCAQCSVTTLTPAIDDQSAPSFTPAVGISVLSRSIWRTSGTHLPHCGRQPQAR